ncbi:MAG TPA: threonine/serine dehydratase [Planctomycetota bacterium]|nr:threonine/serine dehydratase [Planctomycetota bacterium]
MNDTPWYPTSDELRQARERLKPYVLMTPLLRAEALEIHGRRVFIKPENLQRTGSFKIRGAANAILSLQLDARDRGVVTFSSGNHGAAVAFAAREIGNADRGQPYPCTVVMPENASRIKAERVEMFGAEVVYYGKTVAERQAKAEELARQSGKDVIPSYDDRRVICGQGSIGPEIMDQWMGFPSRTRRLYIVAGPVGGGGLMGGTSAALRARGFSGRIVGVEPETANDTEKSFAAGEQVETPLSDTICDGLRSTMPGELTFPILKKCVDSIATVSDEEVQTAMKWLLSEMKILVEPSGAVAVAAWMNGKLSIHEHDPQNPDFAGDVILIVSGGNVDPAAVVQ